MVRLPSFHHPGSVKSPARRRQQQRDHAHAKGRPPLRLAAVSLPAAPVGLTARAVNTDEVDLSWRNVSRNAQYTWIYRSDDGGSTFNEIDSVSSPANTYRDIAGLQASHTYKYYVASGMNIANPGGEVDSSPSNIVRSQISYTVAIFINAFARRLFSASAASVRSQNSASSRPFIT